MSVQSPWTSRPSRSSRRQSASRRQLFCAEELEPRLVLSLANLNPPLAGLAANPALLAALGSTPTASPIAAMAAVQPTLPLDSQAPVSLSLSNTTPAARHGVVPDSVSPASDQPSLLPFAPNGTTGTNSTLATEPGVLRNTATDVNSPNAAALARPTTSPDPAGSTPAAQGVDQPTELPSSALTGIGESEFTSTRSTVPTVAPLPADSDLALALSRASETAIGQADVTAAFQGSAVSLNQTTAMNSRGALLVSHIQDNDSGALDLTALVVGSPDQRGQDSRGNANAGAATPIGPEESGSPAVTPLRLDPTESTEQAARPRKRTITAPVAATVFNPEALDTYFQQTTRPATAHKPKSTDQEQAQPTSILARVGLAVTAVCMALGTYWATQRHPKQLLS